MHIEVENARTDESSLLVGENDIGYRVVTVDRKYKFVLRSVDPHGFISIEPEQPARKNSKLLQGLFTTVHDAVIAIKNYIHQLDAKENKLPKDKNTRKIHEMLTSNAPAE